METEHWNQRYATAGYIFGEEPNLFLAEQAHRIPAGGAVLSLAEGEGRNGVFLAERGYAVTGVDASAVGLEKARALARKRNVPLSTVVADLADYAIAPDSWDAVIWIFLHVPPELRRRLLARVIAGLRPGGVLIFEAYSPEQLKHGTGGPKDLERLVRLEELRAELVGLRLVIAQQIERDVSEGAAHSGRASVVEVAAIKE